MLSACFTHLPTPLAGFQEAPTCISGFVIKLILLRKRQHVSLFCNIRSFKSSLCFASGLSSSHHGDTGCHACTLTRFLSSSHTHIHTHAHTHTHTHTHTHIPLSLCWGTIKTVSNAATYSSAHTLNCVNVWVHIIFQGCHSLRLFSPVFNYWTPWHCRPRMHDIPVPVRMCVCVCVCVCVCFHTAVCACELNQKNKDWGWSSVNYSFMLPFYQLLILLQGCVCVCVCVCVFVHLNILSMRAHVSVCLCVFAQAAQAFNGQSDEKLNSSSSSSFWNLSAIVLATVTDHTTSSVIVNARRVNSVSVFDTRTPTHTCKHTHGHTRMLSGAWVNCMGARKIKNT